MARSRRKQTYHRRGKPTVEELVERGWPIRVAVRAVLGARGETFASWGATVGFERETISRLLGGQPVKFDDLRTLLCRAFGFERQWLDEKLKGLE